MVKRLGHVVDDGEALWLLSSAAEIGFRVTGAAQVKLVLGADDTVLDPAADGAMTANRAIEKWR